MLLANWLAAVRTRSRRIRRRANRRRNVPRHWHAVERLEDRTLLAAPTAVDDSYKMDQDTTLNEPADGVLANDSDPDQDPLTAILISNVSNGSLTLNGDGSFVYTPNSSFVGTDTFTYEAEDFMFERSNTATVTIDVTVTGAGTFGDRSNLTATPAGDVSWYGSYGTSWLTGDVLTAHSVAPGQALVFSGISNPDPIVVVETTWEKTVSPDSVEAALTLGGLNSDTIHYNGSLMEDDPLRFVLQVEGSSLATGHYSWQMDLTAHEGQDSTTRSFNGSKDVLNLNSSEFGQGWMLAGLNHLVTSTDGVLLVAGGGAMFWFDENPDGSFSSPTGPLATSTLVKNIDDSYTLTDKFGNKSEFDSAGLLTSWADTNNNTTSYAYQDADMDTLVDEISQITGPFGRITSFVFTNGLLSSVTDLDARVTSLSHDGSGRLTSITAPDPDGAGPLAAAVTSYTYDTDDRLTQISDPLSHTTAFSYNFAGRLVQVTNTDTTTKSFVPIQSRGLIDTSTGVGTAANPAAFVSPEAVPGELTNETGDTITIETDRFGSVTEFTDALGNKTVYQRNADGLVTQITGADPDGGGPLTAPVTTYQYDADNNLTQITSADSTTQSWVYDATLNLATSYTDQLGRVTTFAYDANGNLTSTTDALGNVTSYTHNSNGQVLTITLPDPDRAGPLAAPVTSYSYDSSGRLTTITNPDSTTRQFTYDAADNLLTETDELGRVMSFSYDDLDQLLSMTLPDPDGAGPLHAPVSTYDYDAVGNVTQVTDAAGNITTSAFDNMDRVTSVTFPDPDGAGPLVASVITFTYDAVGRRKTETDALGNTTTYAFNEVGRVTSITYPDPDDAGPQSAPVNTYGYDNLHRNTSVTDALSNQTTYAFDSMNRITSVTDALSGVTTFTYDAVGNQLTVSDPLSRTTTYAYDNLNRVTSVTLPDPDGAGPETSPVTTFGYDNLSRQTSVTDALGNATQYEFDVRSRMTKVTEADPDGAGPQQSPVTTWSYDAASQLSNVTDALGRVTSFEYDDLGRLTKTTLPDPDGAGPDSAPVYTATYDILGNVLSETDPLANVTSYEYDNLSRLTKLTEADPDDAGPLVSPVTTYTYNAASQITSVDDPLNRTTSFEYDNLGQRTKITLPDPDGGGPDSAPVYTSAYDAMGNVVKQTDALGNETQFEFDALYRMTKLTEADPDGAGPLASPVTTWQFDAASQLTSTTDGENRTTSFEYDELGRQTKTTLPDPDGAGPQTGAIHTTAYDAVGNVISETDPLNQTTQFAHDNLHRATSLTDANNAVTTLEFDLVGNRTKLTDAEGNSTTFQFDGLDRLTSETNALNDVRSYAYDAVGNAITRTDRNGRVSEFDYDNLHRPTEERWKNGATVVETISFTFDAASQLTSASDSNSSYSYTFDDLGRVTTIDNAGTTGAPNLVLTNTFDAAGNRTEVAATIDSTADFKNTYQYDALGRTTRIEQTGQTGGNSVADKRVDLAYNAVGQFTAIDRYADLAATLLVAGTAYTFDGAGRLTDLDHTKSTTGDLAAYSWTFDGAHRVTSFSSPDGTSNYSYDSTGQLTSATHTFQTDESFSYDDAGNRTNTGYSIGTNNRLNSDGTYDYEYDDEGNRTKKTTISTGDYVEYTWDHHNRLTKVVFKDSTDTTTKSVAYTYDVFNRRIAKQVDDDGNGSFDRAEYFLYDHAGKLDPGVGVSLDDIVFVYSDADGDGPGSATLSSRILHGPGLDQAVADEDSAGDVYWALADNLGSVRDVVEYDDVADETDVVNHIKYDAFGNITSESDPTIDFLYGFTGREWDGDADLFYYRARWYDASVGRFISEDPMGFGAGDANISRYVGNSPTNAVDPSGLARWVWPWDPNASWNVADTLRTHGQMWKDAIYVGDVSAPADVSKAAMAAAAQSYIRNAGLGHQALNAVGPGGTAVSSVLYIAEGGDLHNHVMNAIPRDIWVGPLGGPQGPQMPNPNLPMNQQFMIFIRDYWEYIAIVGTLADTMVGMQDSINCFVAGTHVLMAEGSQQAVVASSASVSGTHQAGVPSWTTILLAAATVPLAVAGYRFSRRSPAAARRRKRRVDHRQRDDVFANGSWDDLWSVDREGENLAGPPKSLDGCGLVERASVSRQMVNSVPDPMPPKIQSKMDESEMPSQNRRSRFAVAWLVVWLALGASLLFHGLGGSLSDLDQPVLAGTGNTAKLQLTKPIEQIRAGERVAFAHNPAEPFDDSLGHEVDPATWRQIELRLDGRSEQRADVVLLRPKWWIDARLKQNGRRLTLSVPEVGLSGDMEVVAVKPCPRIPPGRGGVVIGTFAHRAAETIELNLEDLDQPIRCTPNHATWSHDRHKFVEAQELQLGECVQGSRSLHRVTRIVHINEPIEVYNLEIHGQHVYQVSSLRVLVHNAGPGGTGPGGSGSPDITADDLKGKTRDEIRQMADDKGLIEKGIPDSVDGGIRKWKDPITNQDRLRLDHGHIDPGTGMPYDNPNAAVDHVHGYQPDGVTKIGDPVTGDPHFPTK